ncbi:hypothetical protein SERLA73DRAFT_162987 [Serpula lacrymans var. lacrymans S7.3]|uniref:Nephrocystin 3-like N-terminal domain-containing protein n=1 Tax=Serpula lacrymans var. lacrymans (strain S7.3) TaxID=936435 RepID=F8QAX3_SERL3|nr:hypothetical protein SERLA73DRAFT_162987 [Serpula lacrymans var. lacrymans S7.3]
MASIERRGVYTRKLWICSITLLLKAVDSAVDNSQHDVLRAGLSETSVLDILSTSDTFTGSETSATQDALINILGNIASKLESYIRILDELSKVHPYATLAWKVISSVYHVIRDQKDRDEQLFALISIMEDAYSFVGIVKALPSKVELLRNTIDKILLQTVESTIFIREYTGHGFGVERDSLNHLRSVRMDASSRSECLSGTRQDDLAFITEWLITPSDDQKILWMHGLAGAGKSTISATIADDPAAVIRTLAYQLASFHKSIRSAMSAVIESDSRISEAPLRRQFEALLLEPLQSIADMSAEGPIVIVIDALDECGDSRSRQDLLPLLFREFSKFPAAFRNWTSRHLRTQLTYDYTSIIKWCMYANATECSIWPRTGQEMKKMEELAMRSAGLFIWTSVAANFILEGHNPDEQLEILLQARSHERAEVALDALYSTALDTSGKWDSEHFLADFHAIMGAILVGRIPMTDSMQDLKFNICNLETSHLSNEGIHDLAERLKENISPPLGYACKFWADHVHATCPNDKLLSLVKNVVDTKLLYWLEVISLLGCVPLVSPSLLKIARWSKDVCRDLADLATDASRFATTFKVPITRSASHIYLSTLAFAPPESKVSRQYKHRCKQIIPVQTSKPLHWPALLYVAEGHTDSISDVSSSPDGKFITSGAMDSTVRVWDAETGDLVLGPLQGHSHWIKSVTFSPDSKRIASGSYDKTVCIWDAETGNLTSEPLRGHSDWIRSVSFSPDGKHLATASDDKTLCVWDVDTGDLTAGPFKGHDDWVMSTTFSPDGKCIASGSEDSSIYIWEVETGLPLCRLRGFKMKSVLSISYSPDNRYIAAGSENAMIYIWEVETGVLISEPIRAHSGWVNSIAFSPDGERIVLGSQDKTVCIWDMKSGNLVSGPLEGHSRSLTSVSFSPDGKRVLSGSRDRTIRFWDAEMGVLASRLFEGHTGPVSYVAFSPDGTRIASGSDDATIRIYDAETGKQCILGSAEQTDWVVSIAFSPDGQYIAAGLNSASIQIHNAETGTLVSTMLECHTGSITSVVFGKQLVSGSHDTTVCVRDTESGRLFSRPFRGHTNWVTSVAFSPDGSGDATIRVWDSHNGKQISGPLWSYDANIRIWDTKTGASEPLHGHTSWVMSVSFSPDGKRIVSGSYDKRVRVWNVEDETRDEILHRSSSDPLGFKWGDDDDGWITGTDGELILWIPPEFREGLHWPGTLFVAQDEMTRLDFTTFAHGTSWVQCAM